MATRLTVNETPAPNARHAVTVLAGPHHQPRTGRVRRPEAWSRPGRRVPQTDPLAALLLTLQVGRATSTLRALSCRTCCASPASDHAAVLGRPPMRTNSRLASMGVSVLSL